MILNKIAILEASELRSILLSVVNEQLEEFKKIVLDIIEKNDNADVFLTRKEAAKFLKISITSLWSLDKTQVLPARRLEGKVLYLKSDLLNFSNSENKPKNEY